MPLRIPSPNERRKLRSFTADFLLKIDRVDLIKECFLEDFEINVVSMKRTLVEKVLRLVKHSYSSDPIAKLSDRIRHLYDIMKILEPKEYRQFVVNDDFIPMLEICIQDEMSGFLPTRVVYSILWQMRFPL